MSDDFNGSDATDSAGNHIGSVERTYVDDAGNASMLAVKLGAIMVKHRLIPAEGMTSTDDGVRFPWSKDVVESSPSIDAGDTLEGDDLDAIRQYYAAQRSPAHPEPESPEVVAAIGEADQRNRPASDLPNVVEEDSPLSAPAFLRHSLLPARNREKRAAESCECPPARTRALPRHHAAHHV